MAKNDNVEFCSHCNSEATYECNFCDIPLSEDCFDDHQEECD